MTRAWVAPLLLAALLAAASAASAHLCIADLVVVNDLPHVHVFCST